MLEAIAALRELGARAVVASLGPDGLLASTVDGRAWRARLPRALSGNPTGAGDACVAALAAGVDDGRAWPEVLADAAALAASAVVAPVAGEHDSVTYQDIRPDVSVEEISATRPNR